jgi:hypothetical protein
MAKLSKNSKEIRYDCRLDIPINLAIKTSGTMDADTTRD